MTTLEMRAAMDARASAPAWPAPEWPASIVEATDKRVPSGARGVVKLADGADWQCELTYARGVSMVGKECVPGPVVASVMLRAQRNGERVVAVWMTKPKATCAGCGEFKTPTATGLIAKHNDCAGGGLPATLNPIGVSDYAFSVAYATEGPGWWTTRVPTRVTVTQLRKCLSGGVATVVAAQTASPQTQTSEN